MTDYKDSGVDLEKNDRIKEKIKKVVKSSAAAGHFAGGIDAKILKEFDEPMIVASTDGVGTKTTLALLLDNYKDLGKDLVNHSLNDLVCIGAKGLCFLDYIGASCLEEDVVPVIVKSISDTCSKNSINLIGGETAEMPGVYKKREYDIVGTIVGAVEKKKMVDGSRIRDGNRIIALQSNGPHTNGYSLVRKIIESFGIMPDKDMEEQLLAPHKSYYKVVHEMLDKYDITGIAHITGGGLEGNITRIIPDGLCANMHKCKIDDLNLPVFDWIKKSGGVSDDEMYKVFNMGVGMCLFVDRDTALPIVRELNEKFDKKADCIGIVYKDEGRKYAMKDPY